MLKLIEGDADTFAQRAEMYYKKRPELVNMIEDLYRSYRSLAEQHDLLRLESRTSFLNRGSSHKEWSFIDKSSVSSSVIFDSESEVDDPPEEEDQVDSKLRELPEKMDENNLQNLKHEERIKRKRSELSTCSADSDLSVVSDPELEGIEFESKLEESPQGICEVKKVIEEVHSTEVNARNAAFKCFEQSESVYGELEESQDENMLSEFPQKEKMAGKDSSFEYAEFVHPETETQDRIKLNEPEDKRDSENAKLMIEIERLKEENMSFKAELDRKDQEKREVIRQLSLSIDILKGENDNMKRFIRDSKNRANLFEFGRLKDVFSKKLFGGQSKKFQTTLVAL